MNLQMQIKLYKLKITKKDFQKVITDETYLRGDISKNNYPAYDSKKLNL